MALIDVLTRAPRLPRAVDRPRLRHALLVGAGPGRLLVAPSGSGKTVAAAQALQAAHAGRTGWCRLAPGASGGSDLVRLVAAALGVAIEDPGVGPLERAAVLLDVIGDEPTTVVIDDYDLGRPEECDAVLAEVLALVAPDVRMIVCSGARPAGLVGRASVGHLRLLGPDDLAFSTDEVADLLGLLGQDPSTAASLREASGGWASAVAVLAEADTTTAAGPAAAVDVLLDRAGLGGGLDPQTADVLAALSILPSVGPAELEAADLDPHLLTRLAAQTALLRPVGDRWTLLDVVREPLRLRLGEDRQRAVAAQVAPILAETDPVAAAGVLIDAGDDEAAAELLAGHASSVSPDAAVPLLYRMRPEVRRRLPPLLSAARATVEMDSALAEAEQRLATTRHPRERVEAQVAVGAMLVHRGQLSSACAVLESALRAPRFVALQAEAAAVGWLGLARLWAGDLEGAEATVTPILPVEPSPMVTWVAAEVALARRDLDAVARAAQRVRVAGWDCAADAVAARLALAQGAESAAAVAAARAYKTASVHGGFDLVVAGPVHAWCLARAGHWDEAGVVADVLRRRLGTVDTCARLHADLIAEAAARAGGGDEEAVAAATRFTNAVAATRKLGYAVVETAARRWLPAGGPGGPPERGLGVAVLGPIVVRVDGQLVDDAAWRSRKAREVLIVLAMAGPGGMARDEVIEAVWPDREPDRGRTLLRTALAEVRRVLEPARQPGEPSRFVITRGDRISVGATIDLADAEARWAESRGAEGNPTAVLAVWQLFRGAACGDEPYVASLDWVRAAADRLRLTVADALVAASSASPAQFTPEVVEGMLAAAAYVLTVEPWRTEVVERVAATCRAVGDVSTALRAERLLGGSGAAQ